MSQCPVCGKKLQSYVWKEVMLHGAAGLKDVNGAEISCPHCGHVFSVSFFPDWLADLVASRIRVK